MPLLNFWCQRAIVMLHCTTLFSGWNVRIGQNLAYGYKDWTDAINAWQSEVKDWTYGYGGGFVLHYTQVMFVNF